MIFPQYFINFPVLIPYWPDFLLIRSITRKVTGIYSNKYFAGSLPLEILNIFR